MPGNYDDKQSFSIDAERRQEALGYSGTRYEPNEVPATIKAAEACRRWSLVMDEDD